MNIHILTEAEKRSLVEKQKSGKLLSHRERAYLAQTQSAAEQEGRRQAAIVQADNKKTIDGLIPDWQKRPMNVAAERLRHWEAANCHGNPAHKQQRINQLQVEAAEEEKRIDAMMATKAKEAAIQADPQVTEALAHCSRVEEQFPDLAAGLTEARGLLTGGGAALVPTYYERVSTLLAEHRAKTADAVAVASNVLTQAEMDYAKRRDELAQADALRDSTKGS